MIFEMAWCDCESYEPHLFSGPDKTEEEWVRDCNAAIIAAGPKYLKTTQGWVGANDWIRAARKELEKMGYTAVYPIAWSFSGSAIIEGGEYDDDDREWSKIVGTDLYNRALDINKRIRDEMDEDLQKYRNRKTGDNLNQV